jgi:hypothetical protein
MITDKMAQHCIIFARGESPSWTPYFAQKFILGGEKLNALQRIIDITYDFSPPDSHYYYDLVSGSCLEDAVAQMEEILLEDAGFESFDEASYLASVARSENNENGHEAEEVLFYASGMECIREQLSVLSEPKNLNTRILHIDNILDNSYLEHLATEKEGIQDLAEELRKAVDEFKR